jgi:hypothetical protein
MIARKKKNWCSSIYGFFVSYGNGLFRIRAKRCCTELSGWGITNNAVRVMLASTTI